MVRSQEERFFNDFYVTFVLPKTWKSKKYYLYHLLIMINELKMGILT